MPLGNTSYLQIPLMAENDNNKYILSNTAMQAFDDALNRLVALDFSSGNVTMLESQLTRYQLFRGTGGVVARTLTIPTTIGSGPTVTTNRFIIFDNAGTDSITITHGAGTTVVVASGQATLVFADGLDIIAVASASGFSMGVKDEGGADVVTDPTFINFVGAGVVATLDGTGADITIPGNVDVPVQEEGATVTATPTAINFVGAGVTATDTAGVATVTIPGGGSAIETQDDGVQIVVATDTMNFTGAGVVTTNPSADVTQIAIAGNVDVPVQEEGSTVTAAPTAINFVGAGVTATDIAGVATVTIPAGAAAVPVQEEGSTVTAAPTAINFVGAGVTATDIAGVATVTIPAGAAAVPVQEEGATVTAAPTAINFVGAGVTATDIAGVATVTIPAGAAAVPVQEEGATVTASPTAINFVGAGVTATDTAGVATVTIPGGGSGIDVQSGAVDVVTGATVLNFITRSSVSISDVSGVATVDIIAPSVKDEGTVIEADPLAFDFIGAGVVVTVDGANGVDITIPGNVDVPVQEEGSTVTAAPTAINFVGAGVTATDTAGVATVTIPGGGASSSITTDATTARVLAAGDIGDWIEFTNAGAITVTLNTGIFSADDEITLEQNGTGVITVTAGAGFTLRSNGALIATNGQYSVVAIKFKSGTEATLMGDRA